jgi:hypothetical protein
VGDVIITYHCTRAKQVFEKYFQITEIGGFKYVNVNLFEQLVLVYIGQFLVYKWFSPYKNEVGENSV